VLSGKNLKPTLNGTHPSTAGTPAGEDCAALGLDSRDLVFPNHPRATAFEAAVLHRKRGCVQLYKRKGAASPQKSPTARLFPRPSLADYKGLSELTSLSARPGGYALVTAVPSAKALAVLDIDPFGYKVRSRLIVPKPWPALGFGNGFSVAVLPEGTTWGTGLLE